MKITQENIQKGQKIYIRLIEEALRDSSFKEELINTPNEAIKNLFGTGSQRNLNIVVEDQTDSAITYLNIPCKVNLEDIELTDAEIELIAGGGPPESWNPFVQAGYWGARGLDELDMWLGEVVFGGQNPIG